MKLKIREAIAPGQAITAAASGRMLIQLISPGQGSSGLYPTEAVKQAGTDKVFPVGTHMFMDHPGESESYDRPERTLRDLAAVLTEDARWDDSLHALVAEARVYAAWAPTLAEMKDDIGVSIRAYAETEHKPGQPLTITKITEGVSVDFVTRAGRGGKILEVLESQRAPHIIEAAIEAGVEEATANDTRAALSQAIRSQYAPGDGEYAWLRDFDESHAWFEYESADSSQLYQLDYSLSDALAVTFTGEPVEVRVNTTYVPVTPTGQSTPAESEEDTTMPQIEESRLTALEEAERRTPVVEAERDTAIRERNIARAGLAAMPIVDRLLAESDLPAANQRVVRAANPAASPVLTEAGLLDAATFEAGVTALIESEKAILAAEAEARGAGKVTDLGGSGTPGKGITEAEYRKGLGLSTKEA